VHRPINIFPWYLRVAFVSYKYFLKVDALLELTVEQIAPVGVLVEGALHHPQFASMLVHWY